MIPLSSYGLKVCSKCPLRFFGCGLFITNIKDAIEFILLDRPMIKMIACPRVEDFDTMIKPMAAVEIILINQIQISISLNSIWQ